MTYGFICLLSIITIMKKYHDHITGKSVLSKAEFKHVRAQMAK